MAQDIVTVDLGFVNAYLVKVGQGFVLADTGMASQWGKLTAALASAGCEPGLLKLVVLTHADMDHVGNAGRLQSEWNVPIAIHAADVPALETGKAPKRTGRGSVAKAMMGILGLFRGKGEGAERKPPLKPDLILEDGQSLAAWGLDARVIHLPGHTPGSIAFLTAEGDLVAGDVFANRRRPDVSPFVESFEAYRESLLKAKSIASSIRTVYPGHGKSFPGSAIPGIEV